MLNSAIIGLAAAMVMAAKSETSYLNVGEDAFLVQKSGVVSIVGSEEDIFFGLAARKDGVTAIYVSENGWMRSKVGVTNIEENYDWTFEFNGGTIDIN